jgi:L-cysteine/cystine lyase
MSVEFPVLERLAYLNAGTFGPLSRATLAAMEARARLDAERGRGGKPWFDDVMALRQRVRAKLAGTIGAQPDNVALTSATTDGCNLVAAGLGLQPGDDVVTTNAEHPGLLAPLHVSGATVRVADVTTRPTSAALDAILSAITSRTRLIALSHVIWTTGQVMPVHEIRRESGLPILVDGAQSVGAIDVEVGQADFYTVSGQKWLCGPDATGALYVRDPESLRIAAPSHFSQQSIERDGTFVPVEGASRFDTGWIAGPALAGLETALEEAPVDRTSRGRASARRCRELLRAHGHDVIGDGGATLVSFVTPSGDAAADAVALYEAGVLVRDLPGTGWLRASCGWWTSERDLEQLVEALAEIRRGR